MPAQIAERLGKAPATTQPSDEQMAQQSAAPAGGFTSIYVMYVPPRYDGSKPYGVLYEWAHHDHNELWDNWSHKLDSLQCIYIGPAKINVSDEQAVADALDAIYNLQQNYKIDPNRVYFYGSFHGLPVYFGLTDIFRACVISWHGNYFHPLVAPNGARREPTASEPNPKLLAIAKLQPFVFAQSGTDPNFVDNNLPKAMLKDGFERVKVLQQPPEELADNKHWMMETIDYFDAYQHAPRQVAEKGKSPGGSGASANGGAASESPSSANALLNLAQNYLNNNMPDLARRKLHQLIEKYPNDPAAKQAQDILDRIGG